MLKVCVRTYNGRYLKSTNDLVAKEQTPGLGSKGTAKRVCEDRYRMVIGLRTALSTKENISNRR